MGTHRSAHVRTLALIGVAACCWTAPCVAVGDPPIALDPVEAPADGHITAHLVIRLAPGASIDFGARGPVVRDANRARRAALEQAFVAAGARRVETILSREPSRADIAAHVGLDRYRRLVLVPGTDALAAVNTLRAVGVGDGVLELVELDPLGGVAGDEPVVPDDPNFGLQWSLLNSGQTVGGIPGAVGADVSAPEAWAWTTGDPVLVAVLDSGVNPHPELAGRIVPGLNVPNPGEPTGDVCASHGTHVSGILAARGDNLLGIAGMSWSAQIMPVIIVDPCNGPESMVADGLIWAADQGAQIANMSLQYNVGSALLKSAVEYADALGVIMVAATGNSNTAVAFPARWPETIAVAATTNLDERWLSSNFGPEVDLAAPGYLIWSLVGQSSYGYKSGTSMATPHVSGAIALMLSINPALTADQVRTLLHVTADDIGAPGFDQLTGHGRLNTAALLAATFDTLAPTADLDGDGQVDGADLGLLLNAWGPCGNVPCVGDLNGDGVVDGADLGILLNAWGDGLPR